MSGKQIPKGQSIRRTHVDGRRVYRGTDGKFKSQKEWKLSRRAAERQEHIRKAKKALKEAPRKAKTRRKPREEEEDFEPVTVELNAITYEEE